MLASIGPFQALLNSIGWVLAWIFDRVPNYGVAIIILTLVIRVVLLPLGIKQIKSMGHMQALQPKIKEIQKKYKGNKQKAQEETMKLYKEAGVNPLGGCLPLLLQFPILIAMYSVIRAPIPDAASFDPVTRTYSAYQNNHLPESSALFRDVTEHHDTDFLWMNLQCSLIQSGTQAQLVDSERQPDGTLDCGTSRFPDSIPFAVLLALMIGTTFFQQRQMQKASPPGASSQQQQVLLKVMPVMFGFFGLSFPAGLVLYWTVSNGFQIGQQMFLLRAGHIGPEAIERRMAEQKARAANQPAKQGFMARMMERADEAQKLREQGQRSPGSSNPRNTPRKGGTARRPSSGKPGRKPGSPNGKKKPGGKDGP